MSAVTDVLTVAHPQRSRGGPSWVIRRLVRQRTTITALGVLATLLALAAFADQIAPYGWDDINLRNVNHPPEFAGWHLFGTDVVGRDVLSRSLFGLQTTAKIGLGAAALATVVGATIGVVAGYYGGWADAFFMRIADLVTAYPAVVITLAAIIFFYPIWPHTLILILGAYLWTVAARVIRASTAAVIESEYVQAARAAGASDRWVIMRHVLRNSSGTIAVVATGVLGQAILLDATIEFFSYGMPASKWPSLGNLIADVTNSGGLGVADYRVVGWWTWLFPGLLLALLLVCINLVGDALDDAFNPTSIG